MAAYRVFGLALFVLPALACGGAPFTETPAMATQDGGLDWESGALGRAVDPPDGGRANDAGGDASYVQDVALPLVRDRSDAASGDETTDVPESGLPFDSGRIVDSSPFSGDAMLDGAQAPVTCKQVSPACGGESGIACPACGEAMLCLSCASFADCVAYCCDAPACPVVLP
jgi:hypothetical protein